MIGIWRMVRFSLEGVLAIYFGNGILSWAKEPVVWYGVMLLIVISVGASTLSVYRWIKLSKKK